MKLSTRTTVSDRGWKAFTRAFGPGRRRVLGAMAREFADISRKNFGPSGLDRPSQWAQLSPPYRRWKGRNYGRTGADLILSGKLRRSIRSRVPTDNYAEVLAGEGLAYGAAHQFGTSRLPRRPFLPMVNNTTPTAYTGRRLREVAERELMRMIKGGS